MLRPDNGATNEDHCAGLMYSTAQFSSVQYSAVQYSAEQYSTVEVLMLLEPRHVPRLQQRRHAQPLRRARERQLAVADNVASLQSTTTYDCF